MIWRDRKALVNGEAFFISLRLTDVLVERRAMVRVVDDLSSGKPEYTETNLSRECIGFTQADRRTA